MGREASRALTAWSTTLRPCHGYAPQRENGARAQSLHSNTGYLSLSETFGGSGHDRLGPLRGLISGSGAVGSGGKTLCEGRHLGGSCLSALRAA